MELLRPTGADNLKVAAVLGVSERTIKAHITHLFKKLGTENRTELALLAYSAGFHDSKEPARHAS
jgi:two-component system, NarL family, nitrate/nitrite response regulator NarL